MDLQSSYINYYAMKVIVLVINDFTFSNILQEYRNDWDSRAGHDKLMW